MSNASQQVVECHPRILKWIAASIEKAQNRIAPTWPLDQFIAVNPYWGFVEDSFADTALHLRKLAGAPLTMPASYFLKQWEEGSFNQQDLKAAINYARSNVSVEALQRALQGSDVDGTQWESPNLITQLIDHQRDLSHAIPWQQFVKHQISQHCAAYFDRSQASWHPEHASTLFESWKQQTANDRGPLLQLGFKRFDRAIQNLPSSAIELIQMVLPQLGIDQERWPHYLTALLMDINGWAAWCAYVKWQAQLNKQDSDQIVQLLAIRLAWEWVLYQRYPHVHEPFVAIWKNFDQHGSAMVEQCQVDDVLLHAMEHAYQQKLAQHLLQSACPPTQKPDFQTVFCIDVRSEGFRRALETVHPRSETRGFAGFFGLPIAYRQRGTALSQPQLPGLLAPTYWVSEEFTQDASDIQDALLDKARWQEMRKNASSAFSFVETLGLLYGPKLLRNTLIGAKNPSDRGSVQTDPALMLYSDATLSQEVPITEQAALVSQILRAMGLVKNFARLVLLAGHGGQCTNNPQASGLDCGACGGQSGAINVRLLVQLLNNPAIRELLRSEQIELTDDTWFVAGLHNTTTDELELFNRERVPNSHQSDVTALVDALALASAQTRTERAAALGINLPGHSKTAPVQAFAARAADWAQTRPEWGLANNAAFIVAPRSATRTMNLQGRAFLHDYDWQTDDNFSTLTLIMTAPMVVTNWINMQYYASTVDQHRYGSGSKILHNVVGQRLGVFEGNGGDLRIGLPWQSIHNGEQYMHTPLRLSVMIEAPREAMDAIIAKHAVVKNLVEHRWLHLFQIDRQENKMFYRTKSDWVEFS